MAIFKIKDVEDVRTAFIYEVEADSPEEAIKLYNEELAGSLDLKDSFLDDGTDEGVTVID